MILVAAAAATIVPYLLIGDDTRFYLPAAFAYIILLAMVSGGICSHSPGRESPPLGPALAARAAVRGRTTPTLGLALDRPNTDCGTRPQRLDDRERGEAHVLDLLERDRRHSRDARRRGKPGLRRRCPLSWPRLSCL